MAQQPIAKLVLRSSDLIGTSNINTNQTDMTWNNVNLEKVLGFLYPKYDLFNISLVGVASDQANNSLGTGVSQTICVATKWFAICK
jgi:hypothetical protein